MTRSLGMLHIKENEDKASTLVGAFLVPKLVYRAEKHYNY